jgi:hypothetical protein
MIRDKNKFINANHFFIFINCLFAKTHHQFKIFLIKTKILIIYQTPIDHNYRNQKFKF